MSDWTTYRPPPCRPEPRAAMRWAQYLPPPCPACWVETLHAWDGPVQHLVIEPCNEHKQT